MRLKERWLKMPFDIGWHHESCICDVYGLQVAIVLFQSCLAHRALHRWPDSGANELMSFATQGDIKSV